MQRRVRPCIWAGKPTSFETQNRTARSAYDLPSTYLFDTIHVTLKYDMQRRQNNNGIGISL